MKKILILLTFVILFKPLSPIVEYIINYDYISKVLCINKETPIRGCDGKCYLISELAKSADAEKPVSEKKIVIKVSEILFFQDIEIISFLNNIIAKNPTLINNYSNIYTYLSSLSFFHPPTFIS